MWPEPGKTYVPSWESPKPPPLPDPLPGTKRWLVFDAGGGMTGEYDELAAAFAAITNGRGVSLVDRNRVGMVNKYVRLVPVPTPPQEFKPVTTPGQPDVNPANAFGLLPVVHERDLIEVQARRELLDWLAEWHKRHGLTSAEYAELLSHAVTDFARRLVAIERRPKTPDGT